MAMPFFVVEKHLKMVELKYVHMAVGQNQWYHFGVGAPTSLVYFSWDWDVHWGYGILTDGHIVTIHAQLGYNSSLRLKKPNPQRHAKAQSAGW